ncbi:hypothetical protein DFH08DRAFT_947955 [Mycena albidolilacea]|uniref:Uncharacterized protein n=1 Tax=Mycena albidolilacea TaxID=1033008 RepID=A0AAD7AWG0_9AGAR|nr:hypothetical protein DFH08DRAFT_947955 [Mycena albidolilacea]
MEAESAHQARDNDPIAAAAWHTLAQAREPSLPHRPWTNPWQTRSLPHTPWPKHPLAKAMADAQEAIAATHPMAQAMPGAQEAIAAAHAEKSQAKAALAESQRQSQDLKAEIEHQKKQINELVTERDVQRGIASAGSRQIEGLQTRFDRMESARRKARSALETERAKSGAREDALKTEKAQLASEKNKFVKDRRTFCSALGLIKRDVEDFESQFGEEDDGNVPPAPPRKRRRTAAGPTSAPA